MDERERKRIAASLAPGERLLWCGRPAGTVPALFWILWAGLLGFLLCCLACLIRLENVPSVVSRFLETERLLFVRIGGVGGWTAGIVFGLFVAVFPVLSIILNCLAIQGIRKDEALVRSLDRIR